MKNATGWMTLGQFSEIFFMLALPFHQTLWYRKGTYCLSLVTAAIRYGFFIYGSADEYFTYALLFLGVLLHGVSYDFYYVTAYIYVDKKPPCICVPPRKSVDTRYCPGLEQEFAWLSSWRCDDGKDVRLSGTGKRTDFNWSGMWTFGAVMIAIIAVLFMIFFRESDNEITAIKVDDRDIALTQGEVK
ncbi:hypothetical protein ACLB1R_05170 [Escherichia coli]